MEDPDNVRARLLKVLRLAESGVGGERENAAVLLEKLLRKHSMTMADLDGAKDRPATRVWFAASDPDERTVISQLALSLFGVGRKFWRRGNDSDLGVDVTPSEHAALTIAWEAYRPAFQDAKHALVLAFCYKHGLFASEESNAATISPEEQERAARAIALADVLPVVDSPARRLK